MVARVATWNLQWQVKGFVSARPEVGPQTLLGRFVDGSDVEGIDLKASVVNEPWESLDQQLCRLLLINTVALYEGWCFDLCNTFYGFGIITEEKCRAYANSLQWPEQYGVRPRSGVDSTINILKSSDGTSEGMKVLLQKIRPSPVNFAVFSPRMRVYRMFKEARNAISHQGAAAGDQLLSDHTDCQNIKSNDLDMRVVPSLNPPVLGQPVNLSWREIIGLADMLRRQVVDIDHSLMSTKTAERDLIARLRLDPIALNDPAQSNVLLKNDRWAKYPGGPWIVVSDHLRSGRGAVFHAIKRLLNVPTVLNEDLQVFWPELLAAGAVEVRPNLRDL